MTVKAKCIRDTLKSERARVAYDDMVADLERRLPDLQVPAHATWVERYTLELEAQKFELEQIRQIIITVAMIDLEELKLLATTSLAAASLNR